jgi:hypothetical protein
MLSALLLYFSLTQPYPFVPFEWVTAASADIEEGKEAEGV